MFESPNTAVLAIDGGGSRCRLAYERAGQSVRVETGPANVYSDLAGAVAQICSGLKALADAALISQERLFGTPAYAGLAGVIDAAIAAQVRDALPFQNIQIEDDRAAALRGALGTEDGAIIHCGTGSFFGLQRASQIHLAGGWGSILGDEASARWVGWAALNAALRVMDRTLPENRWARSLVDELGGIAAVLAFATDARPADFGALAPRVTEAAADGDPLAISIMQKGANHVADAVLALGWSDDMALCLTGGAAPYYQAYLPDAMARAIRAPLGYPLDGALSFAREMAT